MTGSSGVLYLDSARAGTFDAEAAEIVDVIAGHLAVTVALLETGGADPAEGGPRTETPSGTAARPQSRRVVAFHEADGSVFVDGEYVVRGIPGRILARLISEYLASGRTQFSNKELRLDRSIELPAGNDNLEARLLVLRKRLSERAALLAVERVGRGRIELTVNGLLDLQRHPARP